MRDSSKPLFDCTIAGEINLDLILYGLPEKLPLEREVLASGFRMTLGSSSAIVAHNLAVLGARVGFVTLTGQDELGRIALSRLAESGVDVSRVVSTDAVDTGVTVLLHHGETRNILTYPGTMSRMKRSDLDIEYLTGSRHFHLSSLFLQKSLAPDLPALFRDLKRAGLTISLDTNDDPEDCWGGVLHELLPLVDILLPNEAEACRMTGKDSAEEAANALGALVPCVAIKCGERGAVVQAGGRQSLVSGVDVRPVDTIGAGDSFDAGFLCAFFLGRTAEECARAGNITGALSTLRPGGTEAFRDRELREAFLQLHNFPRGSK